MNSTNKQLELFHFKNESEGKAVPTAVPKPSSPKLEPSWLKILGEEFEKPYMITLKQFLVEEKKQHTIYPKGKDMFQAFWLTPVDRVKVIILGQDPYHGKDQAHGLCFSVSKGIQLPPSLINIFKELHHDLQVPIPQDGCLIPWAQQGVFLLNTVLSVRAGQAHSHAGKGWEVFTDKVISELSARREKLIFFLWGRSAQNKAGLIDHQKHVILKAAHPSPFSAHNGFFGCKHFSKSNDYLEKFGTHKINWKI